MKWLSELDDIGEKALGMLTEVLSRTRLQQQREQPLDVRDRIARPGSIREFFT
jgi:hypothetical protein